jgi:hypothetical protein
MIFFLVVLHASAHYPWIHLQRVHDVRSWLFQYKSVAHAPDNYMSQLNMDFKHKHEGGSVTPYRASATNPTEEPLKTGGNVSNENMKLSTHFEKE